VGFTERSRKSVVENIREALKKDSACTAVDFWLGLWKIEYRRDTSIDGSKKLLA